LASKLLIFYLFC